jgi:hypothetical protein
MNDYRFALSIFLLAVAALGCNQGPQGPQTVPVTGLVTFQGKAVEGAVVLFHPTEKGKGVKTGSGETDATGAFSMQTLVKGNEYKDGLLASSYQVTIEKLDHSHRDKNPHAPPKSVLPSQYADPNASELTADVSDSGENQFEFALE